MTDSKTATERLRELLDERGVEWWPSDDRQNEDIITHWRVGRVIWTAFAAEADGRLWLNASSDEDPLTPEQAIAATLGYTPEPCTLQHGNVQGRTDSDTIGQDLSKPAGEPCTSRDSVLGAGVFGTRWHELFGTPERAADFMVRHCTFARCAECPICHDDAGTTCEIPGHCVWVDEEGGRDKLLEWLRGNEASEIRARIDALKAVKR